MAAKYERMNLEKALGGWANLLMPLFSTPEMKALGRKLHTVPKEKMCPSQDKWFRAFELTPPEKVKVILCAQDPYPNETAQGLAFSTDGKVTPSLRVILADLRNAGYDRGTDTNFEPWAEQGVLLLNAVLTTEYRTPNAHKDWGWEKLTGVVVDYLRTRKDQPIVFLAWGTDAQVLANKHWYRTSVPAERKYRLDSCHPQAQNYDPKRQFKGGFMTTNQLFMELGLEPIDWGRIKHRTHADITETIRNQSDTWGTENTPAPDNN